MSDATTRLLFPALRWHAETGFDAERPRIERALELGVGGFVLFGGVAPMVQALVAELRARAGRPLLIGSDLERGAGQQFVGATQLPPLAALGALDDPDLTHRAAQVTAREALALGVNWIYAPVADIDLEPRNPIIGTRAFGSDAALVSRHVRAWVEGCNQAGALSCAKHFPGHGRTTADSHATLPEVSAAPAELALDLAPFRVAIDAGVDSLMTAHVVYSALVTDRRPATLSHRIITGLLKGELAFPGAVVTDALNMQGVLAGGTEAEAAVAAVQAGCDALLYPDDLDTVAAALDAALGTTIDEARVADANERLDRMARRSGPGGGAWGRNVDHAWAIELATRALTMVRGVLVHTRELDLLTIDDDVGGPYPAPARTPLVHALREAGMEVVEADEPAERPAVIAVYADIRAWKGRPGVSAAARTRLEAALSRQADALVLLFGHPRLATDLPGRNVLCAWGGEAIMQRAAAQRLANP